MTNMLRRKLRSKSGASMILALVFLLFCSFVGGSVLTSATANAYRLEHLSDQQDFLNQRSAALLVSDLMQQENEEFLQLKVTDAVHNIQEVTVGNGGVVTLTGKSTKQRVITFEVFTNDSTINPMQQLMLETSVWRYLREYASGQQYTDNIVLYNFPNDLDNKSDFLFQYPVPQTESDDYKIEGSLNVTATSVSEGVTIPNYEARFSVGRESDIYDFYVDFGEASLMKLTMRASNGTTNPITVEGAPAEYNGGTLKNDADGTEYKPANVLITTTSTQTTISWRDPLIEKGGAGA